MTLNDLKDGMVVVLRKAVVLLLSIEQDKIRRMPGGK